MRKIIYLALAVTALAGCDADNSQRIVGQLASDRIELTAEFAEPVLERHVVEGQSVKADDLIIRQDTARIDAQLREAAAQAGQQEARLAELTRGPRREQIVAARANAEGARGELNFRTLEYKRAVDIFERKLASSESVDSARAALDSAAAQLAVADAQLDELLAGTTVEELRQAEQQLEQTKARIAQLQVDRGRHEIKAPVAGIIDSLLIETGERPQPGQVLAIQLSSRQPYARVYVPEAVRVGITPGSRARIYIDGLDETLTGHVRWISSDAAFTPYFALTEHDRGRLSYVAKIDLDYNGARLPDGVPLTLEFEPAANSAQP